MHPLAHPLPVPDGGKILHIGRAKTGTTAVQEALHRNRAALEAQGVLNVPRSRHPHAAVRFAAGTPVPHQSAHVERNWHRLARRFRESNARVTVFSSEAFTAADTEHARRIVDELGGEVTVVVTLRALAAQLRAQWQQTFVRDGRLTFDEWMTARLANVRRLRRIGPAGALEAWGPVVGAERIVFMTSVPQDRALLLRRFEALLGLTEGTLEVPEHDNTALSAQGSEFLRQLNLIDPVKHDDPTSVRAAILRRGTWLVQHMSDIERERTRVPKWAAARANEVARGWISELEQSASTFVGRFEDLLVDVDELPDQIRTPRQIDIAEAARFAHAFYEAAVSYFESKPE